MRKLLLIVCLLFISCYLSYCGIDKYCVQYKPEDWQGRLDEFRREMWKPRTDERTYIGNYYEVLHMNQGNMDDWLKRNITMITFIDDRIINYAEYSCKINAIHGLLHGYNIFYVTLSNVERDRIPDSRWEKVRLLKELFSFYSALSNDSLFTNHYFLWIDADAIITQFQHPLHNLIEENPSFDMIIGAEWHSATGVANTGCFFLRHSAWSNEMLHRWWEMRYLTTDHDQIGFDLLYKENARNNNEMQQHILIVPTRQLNSVPPAYLTYQPSDGVLHLMGESHEYRREIFKHVHDHLCSHLIVHSNSIANASLRISQESLLHRFWNVTKARINELEHCLWQDMQYLLVPASVSVAVIAQYANVTQALAEYRELHLLQEKVISFLSAHHRILSEVQQYIEQSIAHKNQTYAMLWLLAAKSCHLIVGEGAGIVDVDGGICIDLLHYQTMIANDLLVHYHSQIVSALKAEHSMSLVHSNSLANQRLLFTQTRQGLEQLYIRVAQKAWIATMLAMLQCNEGNYYLQLAHRQPYLQHAAEWRKEGISLLEEAHRLHRDVIPLAESNPFEKVTVLMSVGQAYCIYVGENSSSDEVQQQGVDVYAEAIVLLESLLQAERQLKQDHFQYLELLAQAISCCCRLLSTTKTTAQSQYYYSEWMGKVNALHLRFAHESGFREKVADILRTIEEIQLSHNLVIMDTIQENKVMMRRTKKKKENNILCIDCDIVLK